MFKRANQIFRSKSKSNERQPVRSWEVDDIPVPIHLFVESRRGSRISLLKDKIHIRLPRQMKGRSRQLEIGKLLGWARERIDKKQLYQHTPQASNYSDGRLLNLMGEDWTILIKPSDEKQALKIDHLRKIIVLTRSSNNSNGFIQKNESRFVGNAISRMFTSDIVNRLSSINDITFRFDYDKTNIKYLSSRWGSCSAKRNINLSVRLVLLPQEVREYVMIHELAHLKEMNHSPAFWKLVEAHCPDYKKHDRWLKDHGHKYDF